MAKKHRSCFIIIDSILEYAYQRGILQSFIINVSILLFLALLTCAKENSIYKPIKLNISSADNQDITEIIDNFDNCEVVIEDIKASESSIASESIDIEEQTDIVVDELLIVHKTSDTPTISNEHINSEIKIKNVSHKNESANDIGDSKIKGSSDEEFENRLASAGAKTGDIQVSIAWDNYNDIDVWILYENTNGQFYINWMNRVGPNFGILDIDMNVNPHTNKPIENIYWPTGAAPPGKYTVFIQHYHQWDKQHTTGVKLRVLVDGKIVNKKIAISARDGVKKVYSFYRKHGSQNKPHIYSAESASIGPHLPIGQLWSGQ